MKPDGFFVGVFSLYFSEPLRPAGTIAVVAEKAVNKFRRQDENGEQVYKIKYIFHFYNSSIFAVCVNDIVRRRKCQTIAGGEIKKNNGLNVKRWKLVLPTNCVMKITGCKT